MQDLSLFTIGFKCEVTDEALRKYVNNQEPITPRVIEEAIGVIDDCFAFQNSIASSYTKRGAELSEFVPLVFDLFPEKSVTEIVSELERVKEELLRANRGELLNDVAPTRQFFQKVSSLCLRRTAKANAGISPLHMLPV